MLAELLPPHVWQTVSEALPVIISLIIIEGLLSVDNALAIAAMASHLPGRQKYWALRVGIIGAYVFRGLALLFATYIIKNPWLELVGAIYLVHLMAHHFAGARRRARGQGAIETVNRGFWGTVASIELMDLSLGVDNVVAAVALSDELWVVITGVFIGILALRFVAGYCIKLIVKLPILEHTAFLLIGYVGLLLMAELAWHMNFTSGVKFAGIAFIIALTIAFAKIPAVNTLVNPLLGPLMLPLRLYDLIFGTIFTAIFWPFKAASDLIHIPLPSRFVPSAEEVLAETEGATSAKKRKKKKQEKPDSAHRAS